MARMPARRRARPDRRARVALWIEAGGGAGSEKARSEPRSPRGSSHVCRTEGSLTRPTAPHEGGRANGCEPEPQHGIYRTRTGYDADTRAHAGLVPWRAPP